MKLDIGLYFISKFFLILFGLIGSIKMNYVESLKVTSLSVGNMHSCALFDNHKSKCWGYGHALGLDQTVWSDENHNIGDTIDELGDNMPYIDIGNDLEIKKVSCGGLFSCFIVNDGQMKCFGRNDHGEIGIGSKKFLIGKVSGHIGDKLPFIKLGKEIKVIDIVTGNAHVCITYIGNKIKCFDKNSVGELGYGHKRNIGLSQDDMGDNLKIVDLGNYCFE